MRRGGSESGNNAAPATITTIHLSTDYCGDRGGFDAEQTLIGDFYVVTVLRHQTRSDSENKNDKEVAPIWLVEMYLIPQRQQQQQQQPHVEESAVTVYTLTTRHLLLNKDNDDEIEEAAKMDAWMETVSWMSDLVIYEVAVGTTPLLPRSALEALQKGFQRQPRRRQQQHQRLTRKGRFRVVLDHCTNETGCDINVWRSNLVLNVLSRIEPHSVESFDIVAADNVDDNDKNDDDWTTIQGLQQQLTMLPPSDITKDDDDDDLVLENLCVFGFSLLLQQIHQSLLVEAAAPLSQQQREIPTLALKLCSTMRNIQEPLWSEKTKKVQEGDPTATADHQNNNHEIQRTVTPLPVTVNTVLVNNYTVAASPNHYDGNDDNDDKHKNLEQDIVAWAMTQLTELRTRQEDVWLRVQEADNDEMLNANDHDNDDNLFGTLATALLDDLFVKMQSLPSSTARIRIQEQVGAPLREVYQQYLDYWRNRLGHLYQQILDQQGLNSKDHDDKSDKNGMEPRLNAAVLQISTQFRQRAVQAIPILAQPGGVFRDMDLEYATAMQGLLADIQALNELWALDHSANVLLVDDDDDDNSSKQQQERQPKPRRRNKWYHKLGARLLTLGINYLQGWLAWQSIRRAALDRERNFPKFPIF